MTIDTESRELIGYILSPFQGETAGFLIPLFTGKEEYWVQNISANHKVKKFVQTNKPEEADLIRVEASDRINLKENDSAIYSFAFNKQDIVVGKYNKVKENLSRRLRELSSHPFIRSEAATFIGDVQEYLNAVEEGAKNLKKIESMDSVIADDWWTGEYERISADIFVGREDEKKKFIKFLNNSPQYIFNIHTNGDGGIGKTRLLIEFQKLCENHSSDVFFNSELIDFYHTGARTPIDIMRLISKHLGKNLFPNFELKLQKYRIGEGDVLPTINVIEDTFYQDLSESIKRKVVLFFDTYEVIQGHNVSIWIEDSFFPNLHQLNPNLFVVIAGRDPITRINDDFVKKIQLSSLDIPDTKKFLKKCFKLITDKAFYKKIGDDNFLRKIHSISMGRPILLALFADWCLYKRTSIPPLPPKDTIEKIESKSLENHNKTKIDLFEEVLIDHIRNLKEPEDIAILYMALAWRRMTPHMFSYLTGYKEKDSLFMFSRTLKPLSFIKYRAEKMGEVYLLHDEMRDLVIRHYWKRIDPDERERKSIISRLIDYYDIYILDKENLSSVESAIYCAERTYYALYYNLEKGFKDLLNLFDQYLLHYQIFCCDLLAMELLKAQFYPELSDFQRLEFVIRRLRWRNEQYRSKETLYFFEGEKPNKEILSKDKTYAASDRILVDSFLNAVEKDKGQEILEAHLYLERSISLFWLLRFEEAEEGFKKAEKIFRKYNVEFPSIWSANWYAYTKYRIGDYDSAETIFNIAVNEFKKSVVDNKIKPNFSSQEQGYLISNILSNLNVVFRNKGHLLKALLSGEIAVGIGKKIKNVRMEGLRYGNALAETYLKVGKAFDASVLYSKALESLIEAPDPIINARILIGLAQASYNQPEYIHILEFYRKQNKEETFNIFRDIYPHISETSTSEKEVEGKGVSTAFHLLEKAKNILEDLEKPTLELSDAYYYLAEVLTIKENWSIALDYYKKSEGIAEKVYNNYRKADAIVGQIMCYYFQPDDNEQNLRFALECQKKIESLAYAYPNLLGKMHTILGNFDYDRYINSSSHNIRHLREALIQYVKACEYMHSYNALGGTRFYSSFCVIVKRLGDIPLDKLPSEEEIEELKNIWIYELPFMNVCRDYGTEFSEIIDFAKLRKKFSNSESKEHHFCKNYLFKIQDGIESGSEDLRFTPMYALMNLQLHIDNYGSNHHICAHAYAELAHAYALNDNIFESRKYNSIALDCLGDKDLLLKARLYIRLGTILYRRGEYARLIKKCRKFNYRNIFNDYAKKFRHDIEKALNYFNKAEDILTEIITQDPQNKIAIAKLAHLNFRKAETLFLRGDSLTDIENLYILSEERANSSSDIWREMASKEALIGFYYLTGQWIQKKKKIDELRNGFYNLNEDRDAPALKGRLKLTEGDVEYENILTNPKDGMSIEKAFANYIIATHVMANYSDKHFYEAVSTLLERISNLPRESARILYHQIYPKIKKKKPKRDIAGEAYWLVEYCMFIHSEVL